jgi:hypothetical protein
MTKLEDIKTRVEELVKRQFPSALFDVLLKQHKRHGFKTECKCAYCQVKIYYTTLPGWSKWSQDCSVSIMKKQMKKFE